MVENIMYLDDLPLISAKYDEHIILWTWTFDDTW